MKKFLAVITAICITGYLCGEEPNFKLVGSSPVSAKLDITQFEFLSKEVCKPTPSIAKPVGEGWAWDDEKKQWWRWLPTNSYRPQTVVQGSVNTSAVGYHTHTCPRCRTTWGHADNSSTASHRCPNCGTYQFIQDPRPMPVATPKFVPTQRISGRASGCSD